MIQVSTVFLIACLQFLTLPTSSVLMGVFHNFIAEAAPNVEFFEDLLQSMGEEFPFNDLNVHINQHNHSADMNSFNIYWQVEHSFLIMEACPTIPTYFNETMTGCSVLDGYAMRYPSEHQMVVYDIIVDYSMPNIHHVAASGHHSSNFLRKLLYVPPIAFQYRPDGVVEYNSGCRDIELLGLFSAHTYAEGTRRSAVLSILNGQGAHVTLINDKFNMAEIADVYSRSKIVLNIHQAYTTRTIEEYRILPALLMGAIVISEDGPYLEQVPYHEYVIFTTEQDFAATVANVRGNYDYYYDKIHGPQSGFRDIVEGMERKARLDTEQALLRTLCSRPDSAVSRSDFFGCEEFEEEVDALQSLN